MSFMKNTLFCFMLLFVIGCGSKTKSNNPATDTTANSGGKTDLTIVLKNEFSMMKNKGKEVPAYSIPNLDSFIVDITGYEFILPSPAFDYIRDGINYPEMLGGSFAYMDIIYGNDSLEVHPHHVVEPFTLIEVEENKKFAVRGIKDQFKGGEPKEFLLAFRFYIDNGKGEQEIDLFKVKVN
jgi:hypothetical protein